MQPARSMSFLPANVSSDWNMASSWVSMSSFRGIYTPWFNRKHTKWWWHFPDDPPTKTNPTKITKSFERSLVPDAQRSQRLEVTNKLSGKKNPPSPKQWSQRMHPGSPTDPRDVATNLDLLRQFFALKTAVTKIKSYWTDRQSEAEVGGTSYREKAHQHLEKGG